MPVSHLGMLVKVIQWLYLSAFETDFHGLKGYGTIVLFLLVLGWRLALDGSADFFPVADDRSSFPCFPASLADVLGDEPVVAVLVWAVLVFKQNEV